MSRLDENDRKIWPKFAKYVHFFLQEDETNIRFVCTYTYIHNHCISYLCQIGTYDSSSNLTFLLCNCRCILTFEEKRRALDSVYSSEKSEKFFVVPKYLFMFCVFGATADNNKTFDYVFIPNLRPLPQAIYSWCAKNCVGLMSEYSFSRATP